MSNVLNVDKVANQTLPTVPTSGKTGDWQKSLRSLYGAARKANSVSEVSKLIQEILFMVQKVAGSSASSLTLVNEKMGEFFFQAGGKKANSTLNRMTISLESGIVGWVASNAAPLVVNDVQKEDRFDKEIDRVTDFLTESIIAVPVVFGQQVVAVLEAINRSDRSEFTDNELLSLTAFAGSESLVALGSMIATASSNIEQYQILIDWYKGIFETLIAAADAKDLYSYGHSSRVKKYTMLAAENIPFSREDLQALEFGALFHDIGKLWIHDMVLRKSAALTDGEWYILRKHALKGAEMLNGMPYLEKVRDIVLYHHERHDGKGYPQGLKGKNIPIGARLVAVADAYDTMTTAHAYREKMSIREAMDQLLQGSGSQFCPVAVKAFITALEKSQEEAANAKAARAAAKDKTQVAVPVASGTGEGEAEPAKEPPMSISEIYEGDVTLTVRAPDGFGQVKQFRKHLETVPNLKLGLEGWSEAKGTIIIVSLKKPMPLASILDKMSMVEKVEKERDKLLVVLRLPASSKVFRHGFNLAWPG